MNKMFLQQDLKRLAEDPHYIFKMLPRRISNSFQHQLNYIIKTNSQQKTFKIISQPTEVRNEVEHEYKSIFDNATTFTEEKLHWMEHLPKVFSQDHTFLNSSFTMAELEVILDTLDPTSAGGPDNIINKLIQKLLTNPQIKQHFLDTLNAIKNLNHVPSAWKDSITTLVYKPGSDPHSVNGYRPISLCNVVYKIY